MIFIKRKFTHKTLAFTLVLVFLFNCIAFAAEYVTTDPLRLRDKPSLDAQSITTLTVGTKVVETQRLADGWSAVTVNGKTGFVANQYLTPAESALAAQAMSVASTAVPANVLYTADNVNFRSERTLDQSSYIETVPPGTRITVVQAYEDGWSKVIYNGDNGYMSSQYLANEPPTRPMYTLSRVNFRTGRSTDSDIIALLPEGTEVTEIERYDDGWSRVSYNGKTGFIFNEHLGTKQAYDNSRRLAPAASGSSASGGASSEVSRSAVNATIAEISPSGVELVDWGTMKGLFTIGKDALITDVWSGRQYYVRSFSNGNHADVETVSESDTATMKATFGGEWSWDTRPVWVTIGGRTFAASINGMPHGGGVNGNNGMNGQICIHFRGSRTHNGNKSHENSHQASVTQAWNAANR